MQIQQVNFYLPEFRPSVEPLRAIHMAAALLAVFIVLLITTLVTYYQYAQLSHEYAKVDQIQKTLQAQLEKASSTKPALSGPDLDAKIQKLEKELERRQELASIVASQNLGNDKGFSGQMMALANASLDSISLETFSLQNGGNYAELSGMARSADQIPLYIQKLRADPSFANVGFGVMNIERGEGSGGELQFSLAKAVDVKDGDKKAAPRKFNAISH